nr:MAG: RNA-dependent RNA polymerase [Rhizoctonia solani mitovirus 87]
MKTKFSIFKHFGRLPTNFSSNFNAMLGVKARPLLRKIFQGVSAVCRVRVSKSKFLSLTLLVNRLAYLRRTLGPKGLCLYLKGAFVLYQQSLGGHYLPDPRSVSSGLNISRNNSGLPKIIPRVLREEIRKGNTHTMKLVSSILNVYRDIDFVGAPKLETIVAPYKGHSDAVENLSLYISDFLNLFYPSSIPFTEIVQGKVRLFHIWKAAPGMLKDAVFGLANYSSHPYNVLKAYMALLSRTEIWDAFMTILIITKNTPLLKLSEILFKFKLTAINLRGQLGKLHAKEEAAGKVRLFAMVDAPTQWALYPLHSALLDQLKTIDQDGTFDQTRPLDFLDSADGLYSYDLTAATDRLPISLQMKILGTLIGGGFAQAWSTLLVERSYGFRQMGYDKWHGNYKYSVGQPMGAYSSWAMLALTHHFLVQASAWKAGVVPRGVWFTNYAVLGDDIVLGNRKVAQAYLGILDSLGMPVNLHKSLVSEKGTCLEFAKRTIYKRTDISPVPLKELGASQGLVTAMAQFAVKYSLTTPQLLQSFGYGWRDLSWLNKPLYRLAASIRTLLLVLRMPKSSEELASFFSFGYKDAKVVKLDVLGEALKESINAKYQPRIASETEMITWDMEAESYVLDPFSGPTATLLVNDLVREMATGWFTSLYYKCKDTEHPLVIPEDGITPIDMTHVNKLINLGKTIAEILDEIILPRLTSSGLEAVKKELPPEYEVGLLRFFSVLWDSVYGPGVALYKETLARAADDLEQRYSPEWTDAVWDDGGTPESYDFFKRYWDLLQTLEEMSRVSPQSLKFERPEGMEGVALDYNAVTPLQIRYYRAWSALLSGHQDLLRARITTIQPPQGTLPSQIRDPEMDPTFGMD